MSRAVRHLIFRRSLMGMAAMLITLAKPIPASAAISNGPHCTNAVAAEEQRILQFYQAEQSYEEKLKVGRERYDQKQVNRAKIIAAMASALQARQQAVVIQPVAAPEGNTDEPAEWFGPWLAVKALAIGMIGFGYCLRRQRARNTVSQHGQPVLGPGPQAAAH